MDNARFIDVIQRFPQIWDRNNILFREQSVKGEAWIKIGAIFGCSDTVAKETFKGLREKYVREREKQSMFGEKYSKWEFLDKLSFLDPHIITRKYNGFQFGNEEIIKCEETSLDEQSVQTFENYSDFDKILIQHVRNAAPIWDRRSSGYPSKQAKSQLWRGIAEAMHKDVSVCMLRWKGLREKYIRQKNKFQEGDAKWEFLDDMSFLDKVIQYRRKTGDMSFDDSGDFSQVIKEDFHENSYDSGMSTSCCPRKRSASEEMVEEKREKVERSPEMMFGELVASMLSRKSEREKNIAMVEIMQILTK